MGPIQKRVLNVLRVFNAVSSRNANVQVGAAVSGCPDIRPPFDGRDVYQLSMNG